MRILTLSISLMVGFISTPLYGSSSTTQPVDEHEWKILFPSTRMLNQGREVADSACAGCHGQDGLSTGDGVPQLAGQRAIFLYRALEAYLDGSRDDEDRQHKGFMDNDSLMAVSAYYASLTAASLAEKPDLATQTEMLEADPFMVIREPIKKCVKCHGESGNGGGSGMPNLTAQHPEYFIASMMGYLDGSRNHTLMKRLAGNLDESTLKDMGVFYAVQEPERTQTQGEGDINVGRRLAQGCSSCHGVDGNANQDSMPSLAGQDARYFIKAMNQYKGGKRQHAKMFEAVVDLSEQDLIDLATFYAAQQPVKRAVRAPLKSNQWIARCARCHGVDGNGSDPRFPMLAGQEVNYLKKRLKTFSAKQHGDSTMHAMADPLSAMDVERIANYFASQQPKAVIYIPLTRKDNQ